jgi:outer membrane protein assembly factor BamA
VDPDSLKVSQQEIPLFSQPTKISLFGITWIRDRREEDPTDPYRGNFINADASIAAKNLGSSASFARFFFQHSSFYRLRRNLVLARSARLGLQEPLGDTVLDEIPLPERFFAGGGNSLRGFGLNQAGPRHSLTTGTLEATGFPVGGLAMLVFNQELRFPMPRLPWVGDKLGGALFYDAGNVFKRADKITFRWQPTAADIQSGDLSFFSHTIGVGVRYATPVGPLRVDIGYLLNPPEFRVQPPMGLETRQRLPRLQFFFSIGSIF